MRPLLPVLAALQLSLSACTFSIPVNPAVCFGCAAEDAAVEDGGDLRPPPAGPGEAGPFPVAVMDLSVQVAGNGPVGRVQLTLFGPGDGETLSMDGAPYPLVVLSPGLTMARQQYRRYAERLASHGMVAVVQQPRIEWNHEDYRADTRALLSWLIAPTGDGADRVKGRIDAARVGLAGHGLGGKLSVLVSAADDRVKALAALDPVDSPGLGRPISVLDEVAKVRLPAGAPLLLIGEALSKGTACVPAEGNHEAVYTRAPSPTWSISFPQGAYSDFVEDLLTCGPCQTCPPGAAPQRTRELAQKYLTAYFLWTLGGRTEARDYLDGEAFQRDAQGGAVIRKQK
jgi:hypothetical protein